MTKEELFKLGYKEFIKMVNPDCTSCTSCYNCTDCSNCYGCFNCQNQKDKDYMVNNIQLTEEEYRDFMDR